MSTAAAPAAAVQFPFPKRPEVGSTVEVAPGVLWLRLALPFRLDQVNVYRPGDGPGWTILDTDIGNDDAKALW